MSDKELYLKELNEQGKVLFSSDKYEEAIKKYMRAIEEDPMYLKTYFKICKILPQKKKRGRERAIK